MSLKFYRRVAFGLSPNEKQDKHSRSCKYSNIIRHLEGSVVQLCCPGNGWYFPAFDADAEGQLVHAFGEDAGLALRNRPGAH